MKAITFKSDSDKKINLLVQVAKEMGIETYKVRELTDEEMALPGYKPSKDELEEWLAKDDGEKYGIDEAFTIAAKTLKKF